MTLTNRTFLTRGLAAVATLALAAAWLVAGPLALRASAAPFNVSSAAELRAALAVAAVNDQDDVITLVSNFTWTGAGDATYVDDGYSLEIDGNGHKITGGSGTVGLMVNYYGGGTGSFDMHDITISGLKTLQAVSADAAVSATLENVTVKGTVGDAAAVYLAGDTVTVTDSTFKNNETTVEYGGALYLYPNSGAATITGSTFTNNSSADDGGAVYVHGSVDSLDSTYTGNSTTVAGINGGAITATETVTVDGGTFTDNVTTDYGGAIYGGYAVVVDDATFTGNSATQGGAIWSATFVTIGDTAGSTFTDNVAAGDGGAIYSNSITDIYDSSFTGNSSTSGEGGAVYSDDNLDIEYTTFDDNTATYTGRSGGAVFTYADATVLGSEFTNNQAIYGGALYVYDVATINDSTFANNFASTNGGAVYDGDGSVDVTNSTFDSNTAGYTGGAVWSYSTVTSTFSTFVENNSVAEGGAISVSSGNLVSEGSVFYTYTPSFIILCDVGGSATSSGYNYVSDSGCLGTPTTGDVVTAADPQVGALADNGGPAQTMEPLTGSPLIDAAGACSVSDDQRGAARPEAGGTLCDIGAVEAIADTTFDIVTSSGTIHVTATNLTCVNSFAAIDEVDLTTAPPSKLLLPFGGFTFDVCVPDDGWTTTVTLDLPSPVKQLWKLNGTTWSKVPGVTISGSTLTYQITDGGPLDDDGSADGQIVDPGAPAIVLSLTG